VTTGNRRNVSFHGTGTDMSTFNMREVFPMAQVLQDDKEWVRQTSVDSQDSVLCSPPLHEPHSSVTLSSSIHLGGRLLLETQGQALTPQKFRMVVDCELPSMLNR
jgi:hypothetical protein